MNNIDVLCEGLKNFGVEPSDKIVNDFKTYKELLLEWNKNINLTSIEDEREIFIKHFIDSISYINTMYLKDGDKIIDVGTGAGFPGIPIKICKDDIKLTLLDSLNKRINFLKEVCNNLSTSNVEFVHSRAEDAGLDEKYREQYDISTARAVASLPILMEYCVPFVKIGGYFICLKGPLADEELKESVKAMKILGVEFVEKIVIELPTTDLNHNVLVFKKINKTPSKYPRKAGKPSRNPIK